MKRLDSSVSLNHDFDESGTIEARGFGWQVK